MFDHRVSVLHAHPQFKGGETAIPFGLNSRVGASRDVKVIFAGGPTAGAMGIGVESPFHHTFTYTTGAHRVLDNPPLKVGWKCVHGPFQGLPINLGLSFNRDGPMFGPLCLKIRESHKFLDKVGVQV